MNSYVEMMKAQGWHVYVRSFNAAYCFCTDGVKICYAQWSDGQPRVSTVHRPNKQSGTGFHIADEITPRTIRDAMNTVAPQWASTGDRQSVVKYKNWDEYHHANKFNTELFEV